VNDRIVIVPTYNERENIEALIRKVFSLNVPFDMLIIEDSSPDGTAAIVKELQKEFPPYSDETATNRNHLHIVERQGKLGLGTAYIHGFKWALERHYNYMFEMDADFSHNPDDLVHLYNACFNGADLAIGSRYINGINVVNWSIGRIIMSYYASAYVRLVTGMKVRDTTAGFKCYKREVLETINLDTINAKGYLFQIQMKFTAWKYKFNIAEVPVVFTDRVMGTSKMSGGIFNEAIWGVIILKWKSLFKKYERKKSS